MKTVSRVTTLLRWKKNHYLSFIRPRILYASSLDSLNNLVSHFNRERFLAKKKMFPVAMKKLKDILLLM